MVSSNVHEMNQPTARFVIAYTFPYIHLILGCKFSIPRFHHGYTFYIKIWDLKKAFTLLTKVGKNDNEMTQHFGILCLCKINKPTICKFGWSLVIIWPVFICLFLFKYSTQDWTNKCDISSSYTSRFLLTCYVGLIQRNTAVATASESTVEGTMRVLCSYWMSEYPHSTLNGTPTYSSHRCTP